MTRNVRRKKRRKQRWVGPVLTVGFVCLSTLLIVQLFRIENTPKVQQAQPTNHEIKGRSLALAPKTVTTQATLAAIGDILIHDWIYNDAKTSVGYDFHPMFEPVLPILQKPDVLLANQETILGGEALGISSYPMFNSPVEIGPAVKEAGVDIVSTANNHSLDRREQGVLASLEQLDRIGLPHVGTYKSKEDQQTVTIMEKNGIRFSFLSYTYGTNGMPIPSGKDYLVNLIDRDSMAEEIQRAKDISDVVIMSIHWGNEYQRYPTDEQEELAQFLVNQGVDVIFGHHPHVLQPMKWLETSDGRQALVVYSLGNFLSGQIRDYKDIGGMASITVIKTINNLGTTIELKQPEFVPTYVSSQQFKHYRIVPLQEADSFGMANAKNRYEEIMQHMLSPLHSP